jgi:signal transduction histidine kinase
VEDTQWCEIEVEDNGKGFTTELKQNGRAFEHFTRYRPTEKLPPGTGLGLAIVKQRVDAHGGTVEIVDAPGACIRIRLPRWKKEAQ